MLLVGAVSRETASTDCAVVLVGALVVVVDDLCLAGSVDVTGATVVVVVVVDLGTPGFLVVVVGTAGTILALAASRDDEDRGESFTSSKFKMSSGRNPSVQSDFNFD